MEAPLDQIPFDTFLYVAMALAFLFAAWSAAGLRGAYRSIGHGRISLDVPYSDDDPVDRGGAR
jgi:ABC-type arginine transport system permease subunit